MLAGRGQLSDVAWPSRSCSGPETGRSHEPEVPDGEGPGHDSASGGTHFGESQLEGGATGFPGMP